MDKSAVTAFSFGMDDDAPPVSAAGSTRAPPAATVGAAASIVVVAQHTDGVADGASVAPDIAASADASDTATATDHVVTVAEVPSATSVSY